MQGFRGIYPGSLCLFSLVANSPHFTYLRIAIFYLMFKKLPPAFRNFYIVTGVCFLFWMTFLDSNDFISRFKMGAKLRSLENEKEYYKEKIADVEKDRSELMTNKELLEKFAREKYLMKKEKEDLFIIQED